jgi:hypothetical protein
MFRFALSLVVGLVFLGSASAQNLNLLSVERQAKIRAQIEAAKIPAVRLSEMQIATLKARAPKDQVVWVHAGRQSDGKTFVCLVTHGKNRFFGGTHTQLFAGTFESDGSFHQTLDYLQSLSAVVNACRRRGFDPPVKIRYGF